MKHKTQYSKILFILSFSFLLGSLLNSCGGGNLPAIKATSPIAIMAQRNIPDEDIEIPFNPAMAMAPDGGVALMRIESKKKMVIEHYTADTLGVDWAINLEKEKGDSWDMQMRYRNGLLYCMGPNIFADGDSVAIHLLTIDPSKPAIQNEKWGTKTEAGTPTIWHPRPVLTKYSTEVSPDSNLVLFYRMDNSEIYNGSSDSPRAAKMHCEMYQSDCTLKKAFDLTIPAPAAMSDAEMILMHKGFKMDNQGNMYHMKFKQPNKLEVTQYPLGDLTAPVTLSTTLKDCDLESDFKVGTPFVCFDPVTNAMLITATREKIASGSIFMPKVLTVMSDGSSKGLIHASFDFSSKKVNSFQYEPAKEFLDTLIDQKTLTDYRVVKVVHDNTAQKTHIFMEKRQKGVSTSSHSSYTPRNNTPGAAPNMAAGHTSGDWTTYTYRHPFNNCMGLLLLAFDDAGKPLWQYPLPKDQSNKIDYFFKPVNTTNVDIYYVDRETKVEGLQRRNFDLASGTLSQVQNILEFESDTYILSNFTLWQNSNTALMFAAGSTTFGGQLRTRNPMIFKLKTQ